MAVVFPETVKKILESQHKGTAEGFIIHEKNLQNNPMLKLLCAFAHRWGRTDDKIIKYSGDDYDCQYTSGKSHVADIVRTVLTYLPTHNSEPICKELLEWIADRVSEAKISESWFSNVEIFRKMLMKRNEQKQELKQKAQVAPGAQKKLETYTGQQRTDVTGIAHKGIENKQLPPTQVQGPQEPPKPLLTPRIYPNSKPYQFRDRSADIYKRTYNRDSEPIGILSDAQHHFIHGKRHYILEHAPESTEPSAFELSVRKSIHVRDRNENNAPFHERALSAPNIKTQTQRTLKIVQDMQQDGVYVKMDEPEVELCKQRIYEHEIDKQVVLATKAYNDGRAKAKTYYQQIRQTILHGGEGTAHMKDVIPNPLPYVGGDSKQNPAIHDIDEQNKPVDEEMELCDGLLDKDEDFTGLGIGNLNDIIKQSQAKETEQQDDAQKEIIPQENQPETEVEKRSGYSYRKNTGNIVLSKVTIPQYDRAVAPLKMQTKQNENKMTSEQQTRYKIQKSQYDLMGGGKEGKKTIEPRVYQIVQTANNLFSNEDLRIGKRDEQGQLIHSDSDESSIFDESEASDEHDEKRAKSCDQISRLKIRSDKIQELKTDLQNIGQIKQDNNKIDLFLKQMTNDKTTILRNEKEAFQLEEDAKRKESKKIQKDDAGKKHKEPKAKKFVSKRACEIAPTKSGAASQYEQIKTQSEIQYQCLEDQKSLATNLLQGADRVIKNDVEKENTFKNQYQQQQRQTEVFDHLSLASALYIKDPTNQITQQIKSMVGRTLVSDGKLADEQVRNLKLIDKDVNSFGKQNAELQMPNVYKKPLVQELMEGGVEIGEDAKKVQSQDKDTELLSKKTYLPVQPPSQIPNVQRTQFMNLQRNNQNALVRQMDTNQQVDDIQQIVNRVERTTVPDLENNQQDENKQVAHKSSGQEVKCTPDPEMIQKTVFCVIQKKEQESNKLKMSEIKDQSSLRQQVMSVQLGKHNVVPTNDILLIYQKQKREREILDKLREGSKTVQKQITDLDKKVQLQEVAEKQLSNVMKINVQYQMPLEVRPTNVIVNSMNIRPFGGHDPIARPPPKTSHKKGLKGKKK